MWNARFGIKRDEGMTTQMFHRTSFCLVALIAVFAIRGSTCSGEVPKGNDVRSIEIRGGEPLLLTFQDRRTNRQTVGHNPRQLHSVDANRR